MVECINSAESNEDEDEDEVAMLSRRIKNIMRRRRGNFNNPKDKKRYVPTCYKCGKPGHMQNECEEKRIENKKDPKKYQNYFEKKDGNRRFFKKKKALAAWDVLEDIMGSDESEEEKEEEHTAQLSKLSSSKSKEAENYSNGICFMAINDEDEVNSHSENPDFEEMLNELYVDFISLKKEHVELKRRFNHASIENKDLKSENDKFENRIAEYESKMLEHNTLRAENNALKKTLLETLSKLRPKRKYTRPRKTRTGTGINQKPKQMWVPKLPHSSEQNEHPQTLNVKAIKSAKFNATNPPGPILKWVPKLKN